MDVSTAANAVSEQLQRNYVILKSQSGVETIIIQKVECDDTEHYTLLYNNGSDGGDVESLCRLANLALADIRTSVLCII